MTIKIVSDPLVAEWVLEHMPEEHLRGVQDLGPYMAYGVVKDGRALCGVIYNWYREMPYGNDMRVILYSDHPGWCLPGVLRELFRYPFEIANCQRLTSVVRDGNKRALRLNLGLGFRREGVLRRGYDGKTNAIVLSMLRSECKWLSRGTEDGQGRQFATAASARRERPGGAAVGSKQQRSQRERARELN